MERGGPGTECSEHQHLQRKSQKVPPGEAGGSPAVSGSEAIGGSDQQLNVAQRLI